MDKITPHEPKKSRPPLEDFLHAAESRAAADQAAAAQRKRQDALNTVIINGMNKPLWQEMGCIIRLLRALPEKKGRVFRVGVDALIREGKIALSIDYTPMPGSEQDLKSHYSDTWWKYHSRDRIEAVLSRCPKTEKIQMTVTDHTVPYDAFASEEDDDDSREMTIQPSEDAFGALRQKVGSWLAKVAPDRLNEIAGNVFPPAALKKDITVFKPPVFKNKKPGM